MPAAMPYSRWSGSLARMTSTRRILIAGWAACPSALVWMGLLVSIRTRTANRPRGSMAPACNFASPPTATTPESGRRKQVRPPRALLPPGNSLALREQLIAELGAFTDAEALTAWAWRVLPQKNQLVTSDAEALETAFAAKLNELSDDGAAGTDSTLPGTNIVVGSEGEPEATSRECSGGEPMAASQQHSPSSRLNGRPRCLATGVEGVTSEATAQQSVTPLSKTATAARPGSPEVRQHPAVSGLRPQPVGCPPSQVCASPRAGAQSQ
jgi:hypothetical protein